LLVVFAKFCEFQQSDNTRPQHYDFLGRVDSKTDQAGKITSYGYDNVGRLKTVTQTLNGSPLVTTYGYDEVGERISQTDANNHITLFAYDQLGRRSSRTLPGGGASETYQYDVAGNLHLKTDFNGHTTTYAYDNMNRLQSKTADAFFSTGACAGGACGATSVSFTYTATGRRRTMVDAIGTTTYDYDLRDRLKTKATPFGTISYTYDAVGNLAAYAYPNGVSTSYSYNPLNRLTSMQSTCATGTGCAAPNTIISSYAYTLGPTGNRLSVAELSGRSVTYGYDDLYRLTSETVASDPGGNNGQVSYTLDSVGNRLQRNSTLPAIVATGLLNYDANDRVSTDTFDSNGNTTINSGQTNVYDFENRLVQRGGVKIVYDGDGNRVKETVATVTTSYLVADQNPTGYAQVLDELQGGSVTRTYSYGLELINERQPISGTLTTSFYGYDGHGSVRFLTSSTGAITDTYDYDAFGNVIAQTGTTPNNYQFAGEQFDSALGIYYNRARYYDQRQGRFWTMDTYEGHEDEPISLHKYLSLYDNPINNIDRCGKCVPSNGEYGDKVQKEIFKDFVSKKPAGVLTNTAISTILGQTVPDGRLLPDLIDPVTLSNLGFGEIWEIKSIYSAPAAEAKLALYLAILNKNSRALKWIPGVSYLPPPIIRIDSDVIATTEEPAPGLITYCVLSLDEMERLAVLAQQAMLADVFVSLSIAEVQTAYGF
jgi:RHS repeat-associated protein